MSLSKQQYRAMKIAGAAAIFSALTFEKILHLNRSNFNHFFFKTVKIVPISIIFQNIIKNMIDFANFNILILQFKFKFFEFKIYSG